jgi:hypothetical protein
MQPIYRILISAAGPVTARGSPIFQGDRNGLRFPWTKPQLQLQNTLDSDFAVGRVRQWEPLHRMRAVFQTFEF